MSTPEIRALLDAQMLLGESPLWDPEEAALYWIDIAGLAVHRYILSTGDHRSWPLPSEPGCIARCKGGGLVVAMRSGLALLDTESGALSFVAQAPYDSSVIRFNDGRCDVAGRLWAGSLYEPKDKPGGALYCIERGSIRNADKPVTVSNGVAFSVNNCTLYHSDTTAHRITAYDFHPATGQIGEGRIFQQFSTDRTENYGGRPDGAAVDAEDAYWCAMYEGGRLIRISPAGEILQEIPLPVRCPTMLAFGGDDLRTLFVTTVSHNRPVSELAQFPLSGKVLTLRVDTPGRVEPAYIP